MVVAGQHQHIALAQIRAERLLGDQGRGLGLRADQLDAGEQAGRELALGIVEQGAAIDGAALHVHRIVDEGQLALVRVALLGHQPQIDRRGLAPFAGGVFQIGLLVGVERGVDRPVRHHRGQKIGGGDQVAGGDGGARDAAVDGRDHAGKGQVQPSRLQGRAGGLHIGAGGLGLGLQPLQLALGHGVLVHQPLAAIRIGGRQLGLGLCAGQLSGQAVHLGLEGPRVDLEQHLALAYLSPLAEANAVDEAADAGMHAHAIDRFEPAGELVPLTQGFEQHRRHLDAGGGRRRGL